MYGENIKMTETAGGFLPAARGFGRGVLIATAVTILSFLLFACLLAYTGLPESLIPGIAWTMEGLGALISGFCAAKGAGSRGIITGWIAGLLYMVVIWMISVLSGSGFSFGMHTLTLLGLSVVCGGIGGVLGVNLTSGKTNRRKR